jgi:ATP-dependent DNA helicase RecG
MELKREVTDDLKKTMIAFANTKGGTIYIGVGDDGTICGVQNSDQTLLKISSMVRDAIKPDLTMFVSYEVLQAEDQKVLTIHIQQGTDKPYYLASKGLKAGGVFIRQGVSSAPATENAIRRMIKETDGDQFESIRCLNQELTFMYASKEFKDRQIPFETANWVTLGLVTNEDRLYTHLALLLSDQCVHMIKAAVFQGTTKTVFLDRREFGGSILKQLNEAYEYIDRNNRIHSEITGLHRIDLRDYPEIAVREALLNALVHREYAMSGSTLISIFEDRLELVSLGGLVSGITLNDMMLGVSVSRNEKLAGVFYRMKLTEAYGTGMSKIMESYRGSGVLPEIQISDNAFKITLPNVNWHSDDSNLSKSESTVMALLESKPKITRKEVEYTLGVSQTMAGRVIKQLIEKNLIVLEGSGSKTIYGKARK